MYFKKMLLYTLLGFDAVSESLLIANPQKTFFTSEELESQNKELKRLIKIMNDTVLGENLGNKFLHRDKGPELLQV